MSLAGSPFPDGPELQASLLLPYQLAPISKQNAFILPQQSKEAGILMHSLSVYRREGQAGLGVRVVRVSDQRSHHRR